MSAFTTVSVSGYNANAPSDDGSEIAGNQVEWAKHKEKLGDPLKTALEAINTQLVAMFASLDSDIIVTETGDHPIGGTLTFAVAIVLDGEGRIVADDTNGFLVRNAANDTTLLGLTNAGLLTTPNADASEVGFKGAPVNTQNGNYTLVLADAGYIVRKESGGAGETYTIPANASVAFPIGTIIELQNDGGGDLTLAITSDSLEEWGTGATPTTLADNGKAVLEKVGSTSWKISGIGLS